jgi:hypothetical protein
VPAREQRLGNSGLHGEIRMDYTVTDRRGGHRMSPLRIVDTRLCSRPLVVAVAALAVPLLCAAPVRAQASPDCFKICSSLFYKHVTTLMKCASKGVTDAAATTACATKAGAKMHDKYVVQLRNKCGDASCVVAYPATRDVGCEALVFSTANSAQIFFGGSAVPLDTVVGDLVISAGTTGCGY